MEGVKKSLYFIEEVYDQERLHSSLETTGLLLNFRLQQSV